MSILIRFRLRDKHLHIAKDTELLRTIYQQVDKNFVINRTKYRVLIWSKLIFYLSCSSLLYTAIYTLVNPWAFVCAFVAYGFFTLLFAFNFSHDFSHNTVFKNKALNHFCFTVIYTIVGAHADAWKQRHIHSHHFAPNVEDYDSDLKITSLIRVIPDSDFHWYHRFQHFYAPLAYTTYSLFWIFIKDVVILFSPDEYGTIKNLKYHFSFWTQKLIYLLLMLGLPFAFSNQSWLIVITAFTLMHLFQSLFLLFTFFMTHHVESTTYPKTDNEGRINTSWVMNQIKSSNDMHPFSETANFILGGFNNHIAHHLFPHMHHIHYPKLNVILYDILRRNHIEPNQTTYIAGLISHLRLLKRMGKR